MDSFESKITDLTKKVHNLFQFMAKEIMKSKTTQKQGKKKPKSKKNKKDSISIALDGEEIQEEEYDDQEDYQEFFNDS